MMKFLLRHNKISLWKYRTNLCSTIYLRKQWPCMEMFIHCFCLQDMHRTITRSVIPYVLNSIKNRANIWRIETSICRLGGVRSRDKVEEYYWLKKWIWLAPKSRNTIGFKIFNLIGLYIKEIFSVSLIELIETGSVKEYVCVPFLRRPPQFIKYVANQNPFFFFLFCFAK